MLNDTNIRSTKFLSTLFVILMAYGLVFVGKLEAKEWLDMATIAVGLYQASNVLNKAVNK